MAASSASVRQRNWFGLPGTPGKPIQILAREADLPADFKPDGKHIRAKAWKAAYEGLVAGFGFGMFAHNLSAKDYENMLNAMDYNENAEDEMTTLATMQGPISIAKEYKGLEEPGRLIRLGYRKKTSKTLECLVIAQQWIISFVLQRGLAEVLFGNDTVKRPKMDHLEIVTSVYCRFKVVLQPMGGMVDYLRLIDGDLRVYEVDERESYLVSRVSRFPVEGQPPCDSGWPRNAKQACENKEHGTYMVLTLFGNKSVENDFDEEQKKMEEEGVYVTVTENILRGFTGKKNEEGRYFEYVGPINPIDNRTSRTYYMTPGSSLVFPSHFAVRVGGPLDSPIHLFGYLVRATRVAPNATMDYLYRENLELYDELDEYSCDTECTQRDSFNFVDWSKRTSRDRRSRTGVVGTIPSILKIPINTKFREQMVDPFYDVTNGPMSMDSIYCSNPVLKLEMYNPGVAYEDDSEDPERRMWIGSGPQWMISDVPFGFLDRLTGGGLTFPYDLIKVKATAHTTLKRSDSKTPTVCVRHRTKKPHISRGSQSAESAPPSSSPTSQHIPSQNPMEH